MAHPVRQHGEADEGHDQEEEGDVHCCDVSVRMQQPYHVTRTDDNSSVGPWLPDRVDQVAEHTPRFLTLDIGDLRIVLLASGSRPTQPPDGGHSDRLRGR